MQVPFKINLENKVAVVTGGGGILCAVFAKALAACGAKVAVLDLKKEAADAVADEINKSGGTALGVQANVLDINSLKDAKKTVNEKLGKCDILINGAGGNHPKGNTSKEYFEEGDLNKFSLSLSFSLLSFFSLSLSLSLSK